MLGLKSSIIALNTEYPLLLSTVQVYKYSVLPILGPHSWKRRTRYLV